MDRISESSMAFGFASPTYPPKRRPSRFLFLLALCPSRAPPPGRWDGQQSSVVGCYMVELPRLRDVSTMCHI